MSAAILKSFATWLAEEGIHASDDDTSVLRTLKIPRVSKEGRWPYTDDEIKLILRIAKEGPHGARDSAILLTQLSSGGPRLNELRELRLGDIDFQRRAITFRGETSKSNVTRTARLDPAASAALDSYINDWRPPSADDHVFLTLAGKPFTYSGFGNLFARLRDRLRAAGMKGFRSHRGRHTWATNGHRVGMSPFDLQQEGGWKDLAMVRRYTKNRPFEELQRMATPFTGLFGADARRVSRRRDQSLIQEVS